MATDTPTASDARFGEPVRETVRDALERSRRAWVALDGEGAFVAAFGVADATVIGGHGLTWCLTSERIARHPRRAALLSRAWVAAMRAEYHTLSGWCDAKHTTAVRWLRWLGFTVLPPQPYGAGLFHPYFWSA